MDVEAIKREINEIWDAIDRIRNKQDLYVGEHHKLEKEFVEMKTDLRHVRGTLDQMNSNLTKLMFIIGGSFIAGIVGFILKGGLS